MNSVSLGSITREMVFDPTDPDRDHEHRRRITVPKLLCGQVKASGSERNRVCASSCEWRISVVGLGRGEIGLGTRGLIM